MAHVPVKQLAHRCRELAHECTRRGIGKREEYVAPVITDKFVYEMGGKLEALAENIESHFNDYPRDA